MYTGCTHPSYRTPHILCGAGVHLRPAGLPALFQTMSAGPERACRPDAGTHAASSPHGDDYRIEHWADLSPPLPPGFLDTPTTLNEALARLAAAPPDALECSAGLARALCRRFRAVERTLQAQIDALAAAGRPASPSPFVVLEG